MSVTAVPVLAARCRQHAAVVEARHGGEVAGARESKGTFLLCVGTSEEALEQRRPAR